MFVGARFSTPLGKINRQIFLNRKTELYRRDTGKKVKVCLTETNDFEYLKDADTFIHASRRVF